MKKILSVLLFTCLVYISSAFSEERNLPSEIMSVSKGLEFFIIRAGEGSGVKIGDNVIVYSSGKKIAEAYIIEVRKDVSAAEVLSIEKSETFQEGDKVLIFRKAISASPKPEKKQKPKPKASKPKPKWTTLLGRPAKESADAAIKRMPDEDAVYIASAFPTAEGQDLINIKIHKDSSAVFTYASLVLKENGYSITSSNRGAGILLATKPVDLSLLKELLADAFAAIDHNLVVSIDIKPVGDSSILRASSFREHSQKEKYIKRGVASGSKYYNELSKLISEIKERSEY